MKKLLRGTDEIRQGAEGAALVETALSLSVMLTVMVGIMQVCLVMYSSVFVNEAAREAARYASVRGSDSCTDLATFPNCDLGPTTAGNPLQTYARGLGYPLPSPSNLTVTATWWYLTQDSNGYSQWTASCTTLNEPSAPTGNGQPCNQSGNMVTVRVRYSMPMNIPFWANANVNLTSTSSMLIAN
ncbi:MAG: TadE family protein [Terracidiphilus sp.]